MTSIRRLILPFALATALFAALPDWISTIVARDKLEDVFFRSVTFGANTLSWRKPPAETRPELTRQIQQAPADAQLYYLRAREAEAQLDFAAAEADWARYAQTAASRDAGWREKADYHRRRVEPEKELAALLEAAKLPAAGADVYRPVRAQQSWQVLERAEQVVSSHLLPEASAMEVLRAREARYPAELEAYSRLAQWLIARRRWDEVESVLARRQQVLPGSESWTLQMRVALERARNGAPSAVALYDRSFRPDWSDAELQDYFRLLDESGSRRGMVAVAHQRHTADPAALEPAARLFHHHRLAGDISAAQRILHEMTVARNGRWAPVEHLQVAGFALAVQNYEEAARHFYAAYSSNNAAASEQGLAALIELLMQQAAQPFRFGGGDLSFYRDIATLDTNPGFWNGILSLVLNGLSPAAELAEQERKAIPYFHRASAAELLRVFDNRFPQSARRASLHSQVIQASALHAEPDRVIRLGKEFLAAFPDAPERTAIALATAGAHARLNQTQPEFALYDSLLNELASRAGRVPIGETPAAARNAEYPRVLDRYIARLVAIAQPGRALALYRREIDRNPNDPGLYERLAAFLEQNKMTGEIEATFRRAIQQFPDKTWSHKLARFFLRRKMTAQFDQFTREITTVFSGTELAQYLAVTAQRGSIDAVLYRQVNLYAYRRFPHHIPFVKNLLAAYSTRATADPAERERLLRAHWMYDDALRAEFFELLSRTRRLDAEMAALQSQVTNSPPIARWVAEAEAWKSHFETAAPLLTTLTADFPADTALVTRAASMHRSLGETDSAIRLEETLARAHPSDAAVFTRLGEMQADRERFAPAAAYWDRIIALAPGKPASYLETATLHWDYFQYAEALARIEQGRRRLNAPLLFAFEAGAIYENQGNVDAAAREYVAAATDGAPDSNARRRLIRVATRAGWRVPIDNALRAAGRTSGTLALRVSLLESQLRKQDLTDLLTQAIPQADPELLNEIRRHGQRSGLSAVERRVLERQYAIATHPAAKMAALSARIAFEESANVPSAAAQAAETLLREHPRSVGAIRTAVNYFWRAGQKARAADILLVAAPGAYPQLQRQFRLEAIRKLSDSGDYASAHREAGELLRAKPLDEQVIALKAGAYARANDDRSLAAFYRDTLTALNQSALGPAEKANRSATLRRAWIPALIRLNDVTSAADQYIELLKQFPEDETLQREAARFAAGNGQRQRITAYFAKAETDSPRDARWPIVRARLESEFGDFPAALAAWGRAVALRPERVDLLLSRAKLEERLSQFDSALLSYRKLFEISFRNPLWLENGARVLARQNKPGEALRWLREALVDNRPAAASNHVAVASHLLEWGAVEQARIEAQRGLALARSPADTDLAAAAYAKAATRLRQLEPVAAALNARAAALSPEQQGQFRRQWISAAAGIVAAFYTPEEKLRFAQWLETQRLSLDPASLAGLAQEAGLAGTAATFYHQALIAAPAAENAPALLEDLARLQAQRQQFAEFGRQLEAYHRVHPNTPEKEGILHRAREAYHSAGDDANELRILNALQAGPAMSDEERDRLFAFNTRRPPAVLSQAQAQDPNFMDALANYALRTAKSPVVEQAIANRRTPLWRNSTRALTGLFLHENTPAVRNAFLDSLGPERIGDKLALAGDRTSTLAGDNWFYYAGRYGAWLQLAQDSNAPHYLAALVERHSNSSAAYLALGEESAGPAAEQAYRNALLLDEHQPAAHSRLAEMAAGRGEKAAAGELWKTSIQELSWWQDNRRVPEWFWTEAARAMSGAGAAGLQTQLREPVDALLRTYVKRSGAYRIRELLEGAIALAGSPAAGMEWIGQIARSAADPASFLSQLTRERWLPESGRETLLKLQTELAMDRFAGAIGEERSIARETLESSRIRYASYLLTHNRPAAARPVVQALVANPELRDRFDVVELRLLLAAQEKQIASLLKDLPQDAETLRNLAASLSRAGFPADSKTVLAASYEKDLQDGNTEAGVPGLAALQIEAGTPEKAVALLDIFVMQAEVPFARHQTAAELFLRNNRKAEAVRYLEPLAAAEPWNATARERLAEAREDDAALTAVAADPAAIYADRARAAVWMGTHKPRQIQSGAPELDVLAANSATVRAAEKPLWADARRVAAGLAADAAVKIRLYRGILSIEPQDDPVARELFRQLLRSGRPREALASVESRVHVLAEPDDRALLADAYVRAGQLARALQILEELSGEGSVDQQRRWENTAASVRAQLEQQQANERRRPVVSEQLEQKNLVKPRLQATAGGPR